MTVFNIITILDIIAIAANINYMLYTDYSNLIFSPAGLALAQRLFLLNHRLDGPCLLFLTETVFL